MINVVVIRRRSLRLIDEGRGPGEGVVNVPNQIRVGQCLATDLQFTPPSSINRPSQAGGNKHHPFDHEVVVPLVVTPA